ncbi:MAG TPA: TonB family protein [Pyrinomonadaceae bacterium]|nr:TonB family protein [Pyrinomonadaceae bacterium]
MRYSREIFLPIAAVILMVSVPLDAKAQSRLTYPEISTALNAKLPNQSFQNKTELIKFIITQVKNRRVDKPLTPDLEEDLRQSGATEELLSVIRVNSPKPDPESVVDLGDLTSRATNLVKPEFTPEALKAGIVGSVKLELQLDKSGKVTSAKPLNTLSHGLTEQAVAAARKSTFGAAQVNGKPARGVGTITYNFKINRLNVPETIAAADALRDKGQYDGAIAEYSRVIDVSNTQPQAFFGRGVCYLMKANYDKAVTDLESVVRLNRTSVDGLFYLGIAYDFKGDVKVSATNYGKAIQLNPEYDRRALTKCLYIDRPGVSIDQARNSANGIIDACNSALKITPEFMSGLIQVKRGIAQRLKGDYDKAIADFEAVRRTNPDFTAVRIQLPIAYNGRGQVRFSKKDFKEALTDVNAAIEIDPRNPTSFVNRCVINAYGLKAYDDAIADCSTAIRLTDKSSMAYNHRGYAYEMKNSTDLARADYTKALEIDPKNQQARNNLSKLRPSMKQP